MVMELPLPCGRVVLIDNADIDALKPYTWRSMSSRKGHIKYAVAYIRGSGRANAQYALMHRILLNAPKGTVVDHINGDGLDNRRCNLRLCLHRQNIAAGRSRTGLSRFKGVTFDRSRDKWIAQIKINYQHRMIGRFDFEEDAARAYDVAAREAWGEFATTNFSAQTEAESW